MSPISRSAYPMLKRLVDLLLVAPLLPFVAVVLVVSLVGHRYAGAMLRRFSFYGRNQKVFTSYTSDATLVRRCWRLWDIALGRITFVGPRLVRESEFLRTTHPCLPGVLCLDWLRQRTNVAFVPEEQSDLEYLREASLSFDMALLMRCLLACLYGKPTQEAPDVVDILGVRIDNTTRDGAIRTIESTLTGLTPQVTLSFVNADCLNKATHSEDYRKALAASTMVLSDGIGLKIAGSWLGRNIRQNVNGTDLFPELCELLNARGASLYLYGARPEVVQELAWRIGEQYPQIYLCGAEDGYHAKPEVVAQQIGAARPDVLLVAMGAPQQDIFIHRYRDVLCTKVAMGVGGLFDFYSGRVPRAPQWMRDAGLEWVYRFLQEPQRMWRRYLIGNGLFLARVWAEKFGYSYEREEVATR